MQNSDTHPEVVKFLQKNNVELISTIDDINKIFDFESIKQQNPIIHTKECTIIIFDNPDYNKAFMHEFFDAIIENNYNISKVIDIPDNFTEEEKGKMYADLQNKLNIILPKTKLFYCNSELLNEQLFLTFFESIYNAHVKHLAVTNPEIKYPPFEFDCPPVMIMINPNVNAVFIDYEKLMPFTVESTISAYLTILNAEKLNDAHEKQKSEAQKRYDEVMKHDEEALIQLAKKSNFKA